MARMRHPKGHGSVVETRNLTAGPYQVVLARKRIKRAYLRVDDAEGPVRVSAPASMTPGAVRAFVEAQAPWIEQRRALLRSASPASPRRGHVADDATVLLWGEPHPLEEISPCAAALLRDVSRAGGFLPRERQAPASAPDAELWSALDAEARVAVEKRVVAALRGALEQEVSPLVRRYEQLMGVEAREVRFRDMRTRWGTCNVREHRVWFAVSLAHFVRPCTELIVVHELSHLIEAGHGPRFKACMDRYLPDWRERERLLKEASRGR